MAEMKKDELPVAESPDEILKIDDRPEFRVDVPEWGRAVIVRELDAYTMALIAKSTTDDDGNRDEAEFAARVVLEGCVKPKFLPSHLEALKRRNNAAFLRVLRAIQSGKKNVVPGSN